MYRIKSKYLDMVKRRARTKLDVEGVYPLNVWRYDGFSERILERVDQNAQENGKN